MSFNFLNGPTMSNGRLHQPSNVGFISKAQRVGAVLFLARSSQVTNVHTQNKVLVQPQNNEVLKMDDNASMLSMIFSRAARCLETVTRKGKRTIVKQRKSINASSEEVQLLLLWLQNGAQGVQFSSAAHTGEKQ